MPIATINPATGETVKTFTPATDQEVDAAIARAYERFLDYRHNTTFAQRAGGQTPPPTCWKRRPTTSPP